MLVRSAPGEDTLLQDQLVLTDKSVRMVLATFLALRKLANGA